MKLSYVLTYMNTKIDKNWIYIKSKQKKNPAST